MTKDIENKIKALINTLDFEGLKEALDKMENNDIANMIIERMFEVDEEKAIAYSEIY